MLTVKGSFKNGVAMPDEPVHGHEGQPVLITFLSGNDIAERAELPMVEEVVERIRALGPTKDGYAPPVRPLSEVINIADETPIDPTEWDRQWAEIEAEMERRDLEDDREEGRL